MEALVAIAETEENWRTSKIVSFAETTFEVAFVAPMQQAEIAAVDYEPWWTSIGLDHVAKFWMCILKPCWQMRADGVFEQFIEV